MAAGDISRGMRRRVLLRVNDPDGTAVGEQVYAWLSEACLDITSRTPEALHPSLCTTYSWGVTTGIDLVTDLDDYDLPEDFLWDRNLTYERSDVVYTPQRLSIGNVFTRTQARPTATIQAGYYWIWDGQLHIDVGGTLDTDIMRLYYVKRPPIYVLTTSTAGDADEMSAESEALGANYDPLISPLFLPAAEDFAVARCMESRGNYGQAQFLYNYYEQKVAQIAARAKAQPLPGNEGKPSG